MTNRIFDSNSFVGFSTFTMDMEPLVVTAGRALSMNRMMTRFSVLRSERGISDVRMVLSACCCQDSGQLNQSTLNFGGGAFSDEEPLNFNELC